jgi:hypothetical protein
LATTCIGILIVLKDDVKDQEILED